jgi:hypothetical protein
MKEKLEEIIVSNFGYSANDLVGDKAICQILALFSTELLECLPEEKSCKLYHKQDYAEVEAWNSCRRHLLQNLTSKGIIK